MASSVSSAALAQADDEMVVTAKPTAPPLPAPAPAAAAPTAAAPVSPSAASTTDAPEKTDEKSASDARASDTDTELTAEEKDKLLSNILSFASHFRLSGFLQGEYASRQDSEDQIQQGGTLLNQERFTLRRARVRVEGEWKYAYLQIEIDGNTIQGSQLRLLHGYGALRLPGLNKGDLPLAEVALGVFDTPLGYELVQPPKDRYFMERSTASRSLYPAEPDVGLWVHGAISAFRWSFAAQNGQPQFTPNGYPGLAPTAAKDVVGRLGVDAKARKDLQISGNVSFMRGKGFHPGTDATKNAVQWRDLNEDGAIQAVELAGVPQTSTVPSQSFDHWAVGADAQVRYFSPLGMSMLYGEVIVAQNLGRASFIADPFLTGINVRELGFYVAGVQEVTKWGVVGFRYDFYDPNSDAFDKKGGKLIPSSQVIETYSPMIGLKLPERARLMFQYDIVRDHLARDARGNPTDLKNNGWTLRLQVNL